MIDGLLCRKGPILIIAVCFLAFALTGNVAAKSLYLIAEHHTAQFDAWNQNPDGTVTYQATHHCGFATDPAGVAIWEDPYSPAAVLFITSEFGLPGVELVDAVTMTPMGIVTVGTYDLAGIDVDDVNLKVYTVKRYTNLLYVFDWDPVTLTMTPTPGSPFALPGTVGAFGLALDETRDVLWIADTAGSMARAYDIPTLTELPAMSFAPAHKPVDIVVDRQRNFVYTTSMYGGAWLPSGTGSNLLSQWDVGTGIETTVNMGHPGVGLAVDELMGYVYVTGGAYLGDNLSVWNPLVSPFMEIQDTGYLGNPAGLAMANASYNPLNVTKLDGLLEGECALPAGTMTYQICFDNVANAFDIHGTTLEDTLPPDAIYMSSSDGGIYDPVTHTVSWDIGDVPAGMLEYCVDLDVLCGPGLEPEETFVNFATIGSLETPITTVFVETTVCPVIPVSIDVKPSSCPNPLNPKAKGVLPVAVLGTDAFDVSMIDPATIQLEGVPPLRWSWEDVGTPHEPWSGYTDRFDCTTEGADGYMDLGLKFSKQAVLAALDGTMGGDVRTLTLTGALRPEYGGMEILGQDVVWLLGMGPGERIYVNRINQIRLKESSAQSSQGTDISERF